MPYYPVPTSPVMARSSNKSQPVTPQRPLVQRHQHRHSISQPFRKSPITPTSPYTPLSLRSFTSSASGGSSTLTTPDHAGHGAKRSPSSPLVVKSSNSADHSLADITENWRARANENGIKVSSVNDDSHFGDDEASERTVSDSANESGFVSIEDAPSLIVDQKHSDYPAATRPRAHSHAPLPTFRAFSSPTQTRSSMGGYKQPVSPLVPRSLNFTQNANVISTPPPNRSLARQLKMKGSFTDPAQTRRREAFGPLLAPSQDAKSKSFNLGFAQDTSLDLFDIDENDFENDFDDNYDYGHSISPDVSLVETNISRGDANLGTPIETHEYQNHAPPSFHSYAPQHPFPSHMQATFSDLFPTNSLGHMADSVEHYFHTQQFREATRHHIEPGIYSGIQTWSQPPAPTARRPTFATWDRYMGAPASVPIPGPSTSSSTKRPQPITSVEPKKAPAFSGCSVCLAPSPTTLAILTPCDHPLCSGCLTSALNIVGEKDMECAVCREKVLDFRLVSGNGGVPARTSAVNDGSMDEQQSKPSLGSDITEKESGNSFIESFSPPSESEAGIATLDGVEKSFEFFGSGLGIARASTPKRVEQRGTDLQSQADPIGKVAAMYTREQQQRLNVPTENVVLRIDNVPWDITPPQIEQWIQQPLEHVHVLLDKRGKTMSHAYIEVADLDTAGKILRGEVPNQQSGGKSCERRSVLGKGRRARGVTITRCGQEELMADLFPSWKGSFDGSRPSLAGLSNDQVIGALAGGLLSESEVVGLLHLIKQPDSHFLKAPSLPFYSLISILSRFPTDVDSRVFWSAGVRDLLYDVSYAAIRILLSRAANHSNDEERSMELAIELTTAALHCSAFTSQQLSKFMEVLGSLSVESSLSDVGFRAEPNAQSKSKTAETQDVYQSNSKLGGTDGEAETLAELAKEFGVEARLVQTLAQRLAGLHST